jgi:transposase
VEAILYLDRTGCAWRYLPGDFPPWQTVYGYFAAWRDDGTLARLHDTLRAQEKVALVRLRLSKALLGAAETQAMAAEALAIERGVATEQIAAA